jgi:hypothetical protein
MVFSRLILRFTIPKEGKIPNPKKVQAIVNMAYLQTHNKFRSLMVWLSFIDVSLKKLPLS